MYLSSPVIPNNSDQVPKGDYGGVFISRIIVVAVKLCQQSLTDGLWVGGGVACKVSVAHSTLLGK